MSWEDQGRQYHEWFGHGTAPVKLKPIIDKDGSMMEDSLEERLRTVVHGAIGALPRKLRAQAAAQFQAGTLGQLTEAMAAWIYGRKMDDASFAHHFFGRHADAPFVGSLRAAVSETVAAETRPQLAAASEHLADAIKVVGVDGWPRFVADAQARAHDKATLAAIKKSQQPVIQVSATVGASGSGSVGSGTRLAGGAEEFPFQELMEAHPGILPQGGGAMPEAGAPAAEGAAGAGAAEAPVAKPAPAGEPAPSASEPATSGNPNSPTAAGKGKLSGRPTPIPRRSNADTVRALTLENESAITLSQKGYNVVQNPVVVGMKKPDYLIDGEVFDNYAPSTDNVRSIASAIEKKIKSEQTANVVVNLTDSDVTPAQLQEQIANYPIDGLKKVIVLDKFGKIFTFSGAGK